MKPTELLIDQFSRFLRGINIFEDVDPYSASPQLLNNESTLHSVPHDGKVHDPQGAGSYVFRKEYISSHVRYLGLPSPTCDPKNYSPTTVIIHIGAQPNNSPHAGTIVVFILAFLIARDIKAHYAKLRNDSDVSLEFQKFVDDLSVVVRFDLVDTAPHNPAGAFIDGIAYQRSQRFTAAQDHFLPDYKEILESASKFTGVSYESSNQEGLMRMKGVPTIIEAMVKDHERLGREIAPETGCLAVRRACPYAGCGLAEKHGRKNKYTVTPSGAVIIEFFCPDHGYHSVTSTDPAQVATLEFNTPARNILRSLAYSIDTHESREAKRAGAREILHMRVTGSDYAGSYSEQLLWRQLIHLEKYPDLNKLPTPIIAYAPLIQDWAGSKLSKSLYVEHGAYEYLKPAGMSYLVSFEEMKKQGRSHVILFREVESWLLESKKLFRPYSIEYLHRVFERERKLGN